MSFQQMKKRENSLISKISKIKTLAVIMMKFTWLIHPYQVYIENFNAVIHMTDTRIIHWLHTG